MTEPIAEVGYLAGVCGSEDGTDWEKILIDASRRLVVAIASAIAQDVHLFGFDDPDWLELACDSDGYLKVALPYEEALGARGYQYDGTTWRRSNLLFGYNAVWDEDLGGTATGSVYTASTSTIPAGELWVLQSVSLQDRSRAITAGNIYIASASEGYVFLADTRPLAQYEPVLFAGQVTLLAGDVVWIGLAGTQADDVIYAGVRGYKMKLNM